MAKVRAEPPTRAGPPQGPFGFRVSITRHGVTVQRFLPMLIAPLTTERPPLSTVSVPLLLSELSFAAAPPVVVMTRLIVPAEQPVRLKTIAPIWSPGAGASNVNGMIPFASA